MKFEYKYDCFFLIGSLQSHLDKRGLEGWELVGFHSGSDPNHVELIFKRELNNGK